MSDDFRDWYKDQKEFQKKVAEEELGIVRCKDCKYWGNRHCVRIGKRYQCDAERTDYLSFLMDADDFCSRGERVE